MSLLDDYEELCNAQDISIFKGALDEALKPILIILEERYFKVNMLLNDLNVKITDLRCEVENRIKGVEAQFDHNLADAYEINDIKLRNIWADILELQNDVKTIQSNLNK